MKRMQAITRGAARATPLLVYPLCLSFVLLATLAWGGCSRGAEEKAGAPGSAGASADTGDAGDVENLEDGSAAFPGEEPAPEDSIPGASGAGGGDIDAATPPETSGAAGANTVAAGPASAGSADDVPWMEVDEAGRKVSFDIVAGSTSTNSAWNFNGYAEGDMTITVPVGWTVTMTFSNADGDVPHSLYVLDDAPPFETELPEQPDIPRAYSINLKNGIGAGKTDTLRFPVDKPGKYTMPCGVFGHAKAGMWDWLVVSEGARRPSVTFET
ncbi:MAG: hypothetical protein H0V09_06690 [Gemmatimonadetes bacterium]|nr:hypothetical protein [Gemmatimonadota bacterium]